MVFDVFWVPKNWLGGRELVPAAVTVIQINGGGSAGCQTFLEGLDDMDNRPGLVTRLLREFLKFSRGQ